MLGPSAYPAAMSFARVLVRGGALIAALGLVAAAAYFLWQLIQAAT
jgi:hypothetical protein